MAKAAAKGIPLEDYLKEHPEPLVRAQLDSGELPYTWTDPATGAPRASDDDGPQPPKGWWTRPEFTWIDRARREVRGDARVPPFYRFGMFGVRVYPNHASRKARPRGRPSPAPFVLAEALARLQGKDRANIERRGLGHFLEELSIWLAKEHPNARPMKPKTIGDHLRKDEEIQAVWPKTWRRRRR